MESLGEFLQNSCMDYKAANQETKELQQQVDTWQRQYEKSECELLEELEKMRERVVEGNHQKEKLKEQLRAWFGELRHYKELNTKRSQHSGVP